MTALSQALLLGLSLAGVRAAAAVVAGETLKLD